MPTLKEQRHERFAQALAKGSTTIAAHKEAGFKPDSASACRLAASPLVQSQVAELRDRAAVRADVTMATLLEELEQARGLALQKSQASAVVAAAMGKAKLARLSVEHLRHSGAIDVTSIDLTKLTDQVLDMLTKVCVANGWLTVARVTTRRPEKLLPRPRDCRGPLH